MRRRRRGRPRPSAATGRAAGARQRAIGRRSPSEHRAGGALRGRQRDAMPHVQRQRRRGARGLARQRRARPRVRRSRVPTARASRPPRRAADGRPDAGRAEAVAGTEPAPGPGSATASGASTAGASTSRQRLAVALVGRDVDLVHACVRGRRRRAPRRARDALLRKASSVRHRHDRAARAQRESLRDAAGDAYAGERAGPRAEGDAVERRQRPSGARQRAPDQRQQRAPSAYCPRRSARSCQSRPSPTATLHQVGRRFEGEDAHRPDFTGSPTGAPPAGGTIRAFRVVTATESQAPHARHRFRSCPRRARPRRRDGPADGRHRVARQGGPRHRARRRQGRLRRGRADRRARRHHDAEAQADVRARARRDDPARELGPGRAALPAFRRLRRLLAAAHGRGGAGRGQAARARGRAVASRARAPRPGAAGDPRTRLGLPPSRAAVGAARGQEGRRAGRVPREEVELRRRHDVVRDPAAGDFRAAAGAAAAGREPDHPRSPAADRARGRRRRRRRVRRQPRACWCCASSSRWRRPTSRPSTRSPTRHGVDFWLQTAGPETAAPIHADARPLAYSLPEFDLVYPYGPTEFTQVNASINRVLVRRAIGAARSAAGRTDRGLLLRDRQLHAADRAPRRQRRRRRGQRHAGPPRRRERRAQRPRRTHAVPDGEPVRSHAGDASRRWARWTRC